MEVRLGTRLYGEKRIKLSKNFGDTVTNLQNLQNPEAVTRWYSAKKLKVGRNVIKTETSTQVVYCEF